MTFQETLTVTEALMPVIVGGAISLLALVGLRELLKEAKLAFKKSAKA